MGSLKEQIQKDMLEAMKAREEVKLGALRMLKSAIQKVEVSASAHEASDDEVVEILKKEIKSRRDSAQQFRDGGRPEMADKEEAEIKVLEAYMPAQMNEEEIEKIVREVAAGPGSGDFGRVMGAAMGRMKGKADGALVKSVVERVLK